MADTTTRAGKPAAPAGKGKEFLGQPVWVWAVGAGALILGYLYFKSKSSQQPTAGTGTGQRRPGGGPTGWTTDTFRIWVRDHHGQPSPPKPKPKGK